jgi:hypothetical protein
VGYQDDVAGIDRDNVLHAKQHHQPVTSFLRSATLTRSSTWTTVRTTGKTDLSWSAFSGGQLLRIAFPERAEGIRIISARASPKNEEEGYYSQNPP